LHVEPGLPGSSSNDPHMIPGPDGLTDHQRWGRQGTLERERRKRLRLGE
jgi:hypothetical protein